MTDTEPGHSPMAVSTPVPSAAHAADGRPVPHLLLVAVVAAFVALLVAHGPIRDIDLYWHLLVGQDVLSGTSVTEAARGWSFAPVPDTWVSTQWLAEVLFARLEQLGGLQALLAYRTVTTVLALASLAYVTLWRRPLRAGAWVFTVCAFALPLAAQERSQQVTFILAPLVGWWGERLLRQGRLPRWWMALPLVVVWSNFHGGWVLLPAVMTLAGVGRALDQGWRDPAVRASALLVVGSVAAACVAPSGLGNAFAAARFTHSAGTIAEWQPVRLWSTEPLPFVAVVAVIVLSWAFGRVRPTKGEAVLVLAVTVFGIIAWRNVTPAVLVLAPLATGTLSRALGETDPVPPGTRIPFARLALVLALVGALGALGLSLRQAPVIAAEVPQRLLTTLRDLPVDQRVLNTYNVSGPLLWFGGRPPHVTLGIDGRADRFPPDYFTDYGTTLIHAQDGWRKELDRLSPTAALLRTDEALSGALVAERGWVEVGREGDYVLLHAPGAPGWSAP